MPAAFRTKFHVKCFPFLAAGLALKLAVICSAQKSAAPENQGRHFPHTLQPLESLVISTVPAASHTDGQRRKDKAGTSTQFPEEHTMGRGKKKEEKKHFKPLLPAPEQMAFSHPSHPFDGK